MSKEKKSKEAIESGKGIASGIFQQRKEFDEAHKEEVIEIEEVIEEKKLISTDNFSAGIMSNDMSKVLGFDNQPKYVPDNASAKVKPPTQKELKEAEELENEKIDVMAGIMVMGGGVKPSLIKKEEPVIEPEVEEEETEIDFSYDVTSQFYTKAIKPIDKSPKK